jgi:hypothetical protein
MGMMIDINDLLVDSCKNINQRSAVSGQLSAPDDPVVFHSCPVPLSPPPVAGTSACSDPEPRTLNPEPRSCILREVANPPRDAAQNDGDGIGDLPYIPAGWPEEMTEGCIRLDPAAVLRATPRSFALRVHGQSMVNAGICDGDIVVGEITPEARPGAIVVALIDGESTLKRLVIHHGRPHLVSENPNCPNFMPLSELVIQGVVHMVVRRCV